MKRALKRRDTPGKQERLLRVGPRWELVSNLFGDGDQKWVGFRLLFCLLSRRSGELLYPLEFLCRPISVSRLFSYFVISFFFFPSFSKGEEEEEEKFKSGGRQEDAHMALVIPSSHGRFTLKYLYLFMMKYITGEMQDMHLKNISLLTLNLTWYNTRNDKK